MKFLDPNKLHPHYEDKDFDEEQFYKTAQEIFDNYKEYLEKCRTKISKKSKAFLDLYEKTGWFHDYIILGIDFQTNNNGFSKTKLDSIVIRVQDRDDEFLVLTLKDILRYRLDFNQLYASKYGKGFNEMGGIDQFEIGFEFDYIFINIYMGSDTEINIYFKQLDFKIEKIEA